MLSILLMLAGCAVAPSEETTTATTVLPRAPVNLAPWSAKGKLSIQSPQGSETARFYWQRPDADHDTIVLSGPMSLNQQTIQRRGEDTLWMDGDTERTRKITLYTQRTHPPGTLWYKLAHTH